MSQMPSQTSTSLKIAIAGLGVVGGEVARQLIKRQQPLALAAGQRFLKSQMANLFQEGVMHKQSHQNTHPTFTYRKGLPPLNWAS